MESLLTVDNYMDVLDLERAKKYVRDRDSSEELYNLIVALLSPSDDIEERDLVSKCNSESTGGGLAFRIAGTGLHLRINDALRESITDIVICYLLLQGVVTDKPILVGAALLKNVLKNLSKLRKSSGERCIVESIGELEPATAESICLNLLEKDCRYPSGGCEFMTTQRKCGIQLSPLKTALTTLESRKIVKKISFSEPYQWQIEI